MGKCNVPIYPAKRAVLDCRMQYFRHIMPNQLKFTTEKRQKLTELLEPTGLGVVEHAVLGCLLYAIELASLFKLTKLVSFRTKRT